MIPQDIVQKVIDTTDIVDVVGDFVNLKKAGVNYKGQCPFHDERTPSFVVSPAKQIFKCFGCGEAGSPVSFLMKHEALSFPEAIRWLAKKYSIEIEERQLSPEEITKQKESENVRILNSFAQKHFSKNLSDTQEGQTIGYTYFQNRGFTDETIIKFQLGYSVDFRTDLLDAAVKKGHKPEMLEKAGLVIEKRQEGITKIISSKNKYFDRFRARVMFPIHTLSGNVIAFGGRTLRNDKKTAKYLNSPETAIYHKRESLYGIYFAKNEMIKQDKCYLVEGYTDVISLHQAGIKNVVASSGTSLTQTQIRLVRRFTNNLTLIFDGDKAGLKAAVRGVDIVLGEDMNVRVVPLPENEDPDTFSKKLSLPDLKEYIDSNEKDFILFKIGLLGEKHLADPIKKTAAVKGIVASIAEIPDEIKRDTYIKKTSALLKIKEEILFSEINQILKKEENKQIVNQKKEVDKQTKSTPEIPEFISETSLPEEKQLIYFLLKFGMKFMKNKDHEETEQLVSEFITNEIESENGFKNIVFQEIFEDYKNKKEKNETIDVNYFLNHQNDNIRNTAEEIIGKEYVASKMWEKDGSVIETPEDTYSEDVEITVIAFKLRIIGLFLKKVNEEMQAPGVDYEYQKTKMRQTIGAQEIRAELMKIKGRRNIY